MSEMKPVGKARKRVEFPDAPMVGVIVPSAPELFPLGKLRRAPENVRHTRVDEDVEALAEDIIAHGLLQSLIGYVVDRGRDFEAGYIVGGGRRLQALQLIQDRGLIDGTFPVPVLIRSAELAIELSLAENLQQRTMSPVDEFFAFKALMDMGSNSPASLAKRFGFSERVVKQRLRLAELAEPVIEALAERKITIDAAMAYATCQDRELQLAVFKANNKPNAWQAHDPDKIRRELRSKGMDTSHPLFRFIGAEEYERLGGGYEDDLFNEVGDHRVLRDAHLVENAARDMIAAKMPERLVELQAREDLAPSITGYVTPPDLRVHSWGTPAKIKEPEGFAKVERYEYSRVWNTIRNNAIEAQVLVGIDQDGELVAWPRMAFVPKAQKEAVDPLSKGPTYVPPSPEEEEAERRKREVDRWSRRLAVGPFAGTPFEGRAFWPEPFEDRSKPALMKGVQGHLVALLVFVPDAAVDAARDEAEVYYDRLIADRAEKRAAEERERLEAGLRHERLATGPEPAVAIIDGQAWMRAEDGSYAAVGDEDSYDSWAFLLECTEPQDLGEVYETVEAFDAAMAAARAADEQVSA